jgi:L-rhamnose-H+ transport protein
MVNGVLLAVVSGACFGVCFLPVRYITNFAWENTWFVYSLFALLVFPVLLGIATTPSLERLYLEAGWRMNLIVISAGLLNGLAVVFYGLALVRIGMAVVNALGNGVSLVLGLFIPLFIQHRDAMRGQLGLTLLLGMCLAVLGMVWCGVAAAQRDAASAYMGAEQQKQTVGKASAVIGVLLAAAFGVLQPLMNFGLAFADNYMKLAAAHGTADVFSSNAFYIAFLPPSLLTSGLYFVFLWKKNGTLKQFRAPNVLSHCLACVLIAVIWFLGMILYGWIMPVMKGYGPVLGWPVLMAAISIFSAVVEYFYGDWRGRALRTLCYGLLALTVSIGIFGYANSLIEKVL